MSGRRKSSIALVAILVLLIAAVGGAAVWYRPMLLTGTGYAAHNACAVHFLTGRSDPEQDLPPNPLVPLLRTSIDESEGTASSSVLGVAFGQTAWMSEYGCAVGGRAVGAEYHPPSSGPPSGQPPAADVTGIPLPVAPGEPVEQLGTALDSATGMEGTRALVVVHQGEIVDERYAEGFDVDTRQLGWSMAKSVTSALVGRAMVEHPHAGIDPQDIRLRPEWTDQRERISLDHLLRMTSGLEWDEKYDLGTPITQMLFREPDMAAFAASRPAAHEPGTVREYSSGASNIVCDLLRERTGLGPDMAEQLIFDPLGMDSAILEADTSGGSVCGSYLWATPRDWARFGQFTLDRGVVDGRELLPQGWMHYSTAVVPAEGEPEPYGAHWWVNRTTDGEAPRFPDMPADTYWASGHDGQYVVVVPSADLVVVRMGFSPGGDLGSLGVDALVDAVARALG